MKLDETTEEFPELIFFARINAMLHDLMYKINNDYLKNIDDIERLKNVVKQIKDTNSDFNICMGDLNDYVVSSILKLGVDKSE